MHHSGVRGYLNIHIALLSTPHTPYNKNKIKTTTKTNIPAKTKQLSKQNKTKQTRKKNQTKIQTNK